MCPASLTAQQLATLEQRLETSQLELCQWVTGNVQQHTQPREVAPQTYVSKFDFRAVGLAHASANEPSSQLLLSRGQERQEADGCR